MRVCVYIHIYTHTHIYTGITPTGFPELYLFRAGEHDSNPVVFNADKYNGERGLPAVTKFVQVSIDERNYCHMSL